MFQMRTSKPEAGNPFYNTVGNGGYSQCIVGNPKDSGCNVLANCVGYACGRFNEIIGSMNYPYLNCNAENFIERAKDTYGLEVKPYPVLGGIMVWMNGSLSSSDGAGHVAVVERIDNDNQIYTSESNYGGAAFFNAIRRNDNGRWGLSSNFTFRGCIVNPSIGDVHGDEEKDDLSQYTDEELADMVIDGKFGNGDERKAALGDRYDSVQAIVNEKLKEETREISVGDTVIVNGVGTASSTGEGAKTRRFKNQEMKVIMIAGNTSRPNRYALNQYNRGEVGDPRAVTGWFSINNIKLK